MLVLRPLIEIPDSRRYQVLSILIETMNHQIVTKMVMDETVAPEKTGLGRFQLLSSPPMGFCVGKRYRRNTFPTAYWKYTYHHGTTNCNGPERPGNAIITMVLDQLGLRFSCFKAGRQDNETSCGRPCFSVAFGTLLLLKPWRCWPDVCAPAVAVVTLHQCGPPLSHSGCKGCEGDMDIHVFHCVSNTLAFQGLVFRLSNLP